MKRTLLKFRFFIPWLPVVGLLYVVLTCDILRKIDYKAHLPEHVRHYFSYNTFIFGAPADSFIVYWWLVWQVTTFSVIVNIPM